MGGQTMNLARRLPSRSAICAVASVAARADDQSKANRYVVTPLTSDLAKVAPNQDPVLRNAWGVAFTPGASPFWIADNASGCATLYDGTGAKVALQVAIPLPDNTVPSTACKPASTQINPLPPTPAAPTGILWNPTTTLVVPHTTTPATFIFVPEDGTISPWAGGFA